MVFPVVMYEYESWTITSAECQRIDAFELWCWKRLESPLDCKETTLVNSKGNLSWIFIGRPDAEVSTLWPPDAKSWLIGKDPDAGKARRQEEKGTTEDKTVGWHHQHNGHEFKQVLGDGEGQGSAAAKSLQSCPTLCDPIDGSYRLPHPWDSPGKITGVGCHFLLQPPP